MTGRLYRDVIVCAVASVPAWGFLVLCYSISQGWVR